MIYRHALVCIDLRAVEAHQLLHRAASLTARLSAVSVIETGSFESAAEPAASLVEEEYNSRSAHLARLCAEADCGEVEQRILLGKAAAQIVAYAHENGCDLVVLGEHEDDGRPPGLGFTADAVLRQLRCDGLVVKTRRPRSDALLPNEAAG